MKKIILFLFLITSLFSNENKELNENLDLKENLELSYIFKDQIKYLTCTTDEQNYNCIINYPADDLKKINMMITLLLTSSNITKDGDNQILIKVDEKDITGTIKFKKFNRNITKKDLEKESVQKELTKWKMESLLNINLESPIKITLSINGKNYYIGVKDFKLNFENGKYEIDLFHSNSVLTILEDIEKITKNNTEESKKIIKYTDDLKDFQQLMKIVAKELPEELNYKIKFTLPPNFINKINSKNMQINKLIQGSFEIETFMNNVKFNIDQKSDNSYYGMVTVIKYL